MKSLSFRSNENLVGYFQAEQKNHGVRILKFASSFRLDGRRKGRLMEKHADSKYAIGCMTQWLHNWTNNGWRNSWGSEVANRELIEEASDLHDQVSEEGEVKYV